MIHITLPWPDPILKPNNVTKTHWGQRVKVKNDYKLIAAAEAAKHGRALIGCVTIPMTVKFYPPRKQGDLDGYLGAIKYGLDQIAITLGTDDKAFNPITLFRCSVDKVSPRVEIFIG